MSECRKTSYESKLQAGIALTGIQSSNSIRHSARKTPIRVYLCPKCGKWHLTSQRKREAS